MAVGKPIALRYIEFLIRAHQFFFVKIAAIERLCPLTFYWLNFGVRQHRWWNGGKSVSFRN